MLVYFADTGRGYPPVSFDYPIGMMVAGRMFDVDCVGVCMGFKEGSRVGEGYVYLVAFSNGHFRYLSGQEIVDRRLDYLSGERRLIEVTLIDKCVPQMGNRRRVDSIGNIVMTYQVGMCVGLHVYRDYFSYIVVFANNDRGEYTVDKRIFRVSGPTDCNPFKSRYEWPHTEGPCMHHP